MGFETFSLLLPSRRKNIVHVEQFLRTVDSISSLPEDKYYNTLIAITEAVNNAIIHGNQCDESKIVVVNIVSSPTEIVITVSDRGKGFNPETVANPCDPENVLREGGRGVFLIRSLIPIVSFQQSEIGMDIIMRQTA